MKKAWTLFLFGFEKILNVPLSFSTQFRIPKTERDDKSHITEHGFDYSSTLQGMKVS